MEPYPYGEKIYLESSLFHYYLDEERDYNPEIIRLFEEINTIKFDAYTSIFVIKELFNSNTDDCKKMLNIIQENDISILSANQEIIKIANLYITKKIIPINYITYALHLATCIANRLDYLITFDGQFWHYYEPKLFNNKLIRPYKYKKLSICEPMEMIDYDEDDD
jgi:predicted nucleic acid-binding protein